MLRCAHAAECCACVITCPPARSCVRALHQAAPRRQGQQMSRMATSPRNGSAPRPLPQRSSPLPKPPLQCSHLQLPALLPRAFSLPPRGQLAAQQWPLSPALPLDPLRRQLVISNPSRRPASRLVPRHRLSVSSGPLQRPASRLSVRRSRAPAQRRRRRPATSSAVRSRT